MTLEQRPADLKRIAQGPGRIDLTGAPEGFDALVMADLAKTHGGLCLFAARDGGRADVFVDALRFFAPELETLRFPSWDCLPYDRIGPSPGVAAAPRRLRASQAHLHRRVGRQDQPDAAARARSARGARPRQEPVRPLAHDDDARGDALGWLNRLHDD